MAGKRRDDLDLIMYRLDTIEKRMDTLERALLNKNDSSINTELLNIVLSMVRQQAAPVAAAVAGTQESVASVEKGAATKHADDAASVCGQSFMFNRRKTVI